MSPTTFAALAAAPAVIVIGLCFIGLILDAVRN